MRKVDFDKADANLNDDDLRAMNRNELKLTYAIFTVMEEDLWRFANAHDTFDANWHTRNDKVTACQDRIKRIYDEVFPTEIKDVEISFGIPTDGPWVEYVQKGLTAKFGAELIDVESYDDIFLQVKTTSNMTDDLAKYLLDEYGAEIDIETETIEMEDRNMPDLWSWNETRELVEKSKVTVTIAKPDIVPKPQAEVDKLIAKAKKALIQTGLSPIDAAGLIMDELGVMSGPIEFI
jgi:hypothetical protein